jgi:large repetitive protein
VTDTITTQTGTGASTAMVAAPLMVTTQNINAIAGSAFNGAVATVTGAAQASDLTVSIDWGDGSTSSQATVSGSGPFTVTGTHTYAQAGSFSLKITVTDSANGQKATASATATVAASLTLTGQNITATEGSSFTGVMASGTATAISGPLSASISWGDGQTSTGTVTSSASGTFTVNGSHTYAEEGTYSITTTVADAGGHSATGTGAAIVADAGLSVTKLAGGATKNGLAALAAVFTDADPAGTVTDYTATINWGDGTTSAGTIRTNPSGSGFTAVGAHTYGKHGTFTVTVMINDAGGSSVTKTLTITV